MKVVAVMMMGLSHCDEASWKKKLKEEEEEEEETGFGRKKQRGNGKTDRKSRG